MELCELAFAVAVILGVVYCCAGEPLMKDWQKGKCLESHAVEECKKL